jgi:isoleucyl-tRNA synthetase
VVELGRQARAQSKIKVRQPLRQAYVRGARRAARHADEIRDELRVKRVGFDEGPLPQVVVRPNLRVLGPRLGPKIAEVRRALEGGDYRELPDGRIQVAGLNLAPEEVLRDERMVLEGWASAGDGAISVVLDTDLDDELRLEGRVFELIRKLNERRKALGFELTDRIHVRLPTAMADLLRYADWVGDEVLAESIQKDDAVTEPVIVKAEA